MQIQILAILQSSSLEALLPSVLLSSLCIGKREPSGSLIGPGPGTDPATTAPKEHAPETNASKDRVHYYRREERSLLFGDIPSVCTTGRCDVED